MWTFNDDGTVSVALIGRDVMLRRPKLGEYRMLREVLETAQGAASPRANELAMAAQRLATASAEERADGSLLGELERVREETGIVRNLGEDIRIMWLTLVLRTLDSNQQEPREDEFPPSILEGDWMAKLIKHWVSGNSEARPTVPGDQ